MNFTHLYVEGVSFFLKEVNRGEDCESQVERKKLHLPPHPEEGQEETGTAQGKTPTLKIDWDTWAGGTEKVPPPINQ